MQEPYNKLDDKGFVKILGKGRGRTKQITRFHAAAQMKTQLSESLGCAEEQLLPGDRALQYDPGIRKMRKKNKATGAEHAAALENRAAEPEDGEIDESSCVIRGDLYDGVEGFVGCWNSILRIRRPL